MTTLVHIGQFLAAWVVLCLVLLAAESHRRPRRARPAPAAGMTARLEFLERELAHRPLAQDARPSLPPPHRPPDPEILDAEIIDTPALPPGQGR